MADEPQSPIDKAIEDTLGAVKPTAPVPPPPGPVTPRVIEPVPILLDRERSLRLDFKGMKAFQQWTGLSPWGNEAWRGDDADTMLALIWASLLHEDPSLTLEDVIAMPGMDMGNIAYLTDRLGKLWGNTMPPPEPVAAGRTNGDAPNARRPKTTG